MKEQIRDLKNSGTFTFPGRNKLSVALLASLCSMKENGDIRNIVNLGPGALELPYFSWFFDNIAGLKDKKVQFTGIDLDSNLVHLGRSLLSGTSISLKVLSELATNTNPDGSRMPNSDLTPEGFCTNTEYIKEMFGEAPWKYDAETDLISLVHNVDPTIIRLSRANIMELDFSEFQDVDAFFLGGLMINLRRNYSLDEVSSFVKNLLESSCKFFVFTATPADLNREPTTIKLVQDAGFQVMSILYDKLVVLDSGSRIVGEFPVLAVRPGEEDRLQTFLSNLEQFLAFEFGKPEVDVGFSFDNFCETPLSTLAWVAVDYKYVAHFNTEFMDSMKRETQYQYRDDLLRAYLRKFAPSHWKVVR